MIKTPYDQKYVGVSHIQLRLDCTLKDEKIALLKAELELEKNCVNWYVSNCPDSEKDIVDINPHAEWQVSNKKAIERQKNRKDIK